MQTQVAWQFADLQLCCVSCLVGHYGFMQSYNSKRVVICFWMHECGLQYLCIILLVVCMASMLATISPHLNDHTTGKIECIEHFRAIIWWPYGYIRPVLKHGPRSLTHVQVHKFFTIMHNESDCWHFCISSQPNDWYMIECEHIC